MRERWTHDNGALVVPRARRDQDLEVLGLRVRVVLEPEGPAVLLGPVGRREDEVDALQEERLEGARPGEVPACGRWTARRGGLAARTAMSGAREEGEEKESAEQESAQGCASESSRRRSSSSRGSRGRRPCSGSEQQRTRRTDEHADLAKARVEHLVVLAALAQVLLLGPAGRARSSATSRRRRARETEEGDAPPQVALLVPVQDVALPVDVVRDVLEDGSLLDLLGARLVVDDLDVAAQLGAVVVDGALDDGSDLDVDAELAREVLEGREPVGRGRVRGGRGGEVGVRVRVLGEVPVRWVGNDAALQSEAKGVGRGERQLRETRWGGGEGGEGGRTRKYSGRVTSSAPCSAADRTRSCARWRLICGLSERSSGAEAEVDDDDEANDEHD